MRSLRFRELLLSSDIEQRARRVPFDPNVTVLEGGNGTGKSCILKSVYEALGAMAPNVNASWRKARVKMALTFAVDQTEFTMVKVEGVYGLFDSQRRLVARFDRITSELGPFMAQFLGFDLRLANRDGDVVVPPPQYYFAPFYVDQDEGWSKIWSSFRDLRQLPRWRKPVLEYHTGLVSREYWQNVNETRLAQARAAEVKEEIRKRVRSREEVVNHMGGSPVPLNGAAFAQHLEGLASVATELRRELEASKEETLAQRHRLALVAEQQQIVSDAYRELTGDFEYLTEEVPDTLVECPTCGAQYENSVSERFSIARDASRCSQAMLQLAAEAKGAEALVAEAERSQAAIRSRFDEASRLLNEPVGDVQVKDLIRSESVREVLGAFDSLVRPLSAELSDLLVKVAELDGRRNALVDRKWRKSINEEYKELMASYLGALNVSKLPESCYRTIRSQVRDSGSENIRALIAQFAALLHIIARFGDTVLCPAVVDSPNQHGQDDVNMPAILEFLFAKVPRGMQMIVGVEKLHGVRVPGTVVRLTERDNLLRQEEFASITKLFDSYVVAMSQSA